MNHSQADVTSHFGPRGRHQTEDPPEPSAKELFNSADLVIPAVAIKKFRQAAGEANEKAAFYAAVLGGDMIEAYRTKKQGVKKMIMAVLGCFLEKGNNPPAWYFWSLAYGCHGSWRAVCPKGS